MIQYGSICDTLGIMWITLVFPSSVTSLESYTSLNGGGSVLGNDNISLSPGSTLQSIKAFPYIRLKAGIADKYTPFPKYIDFALGLLDVVSCCGIAFVSKFSLMICFTQVKLYHETIVILQHYLTC